MKMDRSLRGKVPVDERESPIEGFVHLVQRAEEGVHSFIQALRQVEEELDYRVVATVTAVGIGAGVGLWLAQGSLVNVNVQVNVQQNIENHYKFEEEKSLEKRESSQEEKEKEGALCTPEP